MCGNKGEGATKRETEREGRGDVERLGDKEGKKGREGEVREKVIIRERGERERVIRKARKGERERSE